MSLDFEGLLEAQAYDHFGESATLTAVGRAALTITVLSKLVEVEEAVAGGIIIATLKPACDLRLSDLAAASLAREDLVNAALVLGGTRYRVLATAPTKNTRDLRLILVEDP